MQKKILASLLFILHTTLLQADNVLRIAVSQNVGVLNPQGYNTNQMYAQNMIYEGLVKTDKKGNIIPSLAVSWHIKDSGKTYIFQLRENVKFANGELFDANVEALTDYEILVGNLCMKTSNYACSSLGEVYLDHYPA